MTRIFFTGLEAGSLDVFSESWGATISAVQTRTGNYSVYFSSPPLGGYVITSLGSYAAVELFLRIGLYYIGGPVANDRSFCTLYGASGELLSFQIRAADRVILIRRGDAVGALIASGGVVPLNAWCCIELHALIDNAVGVAQVRLDGVQVIDFSGDTEVGIETTIYAVRWGAPISGVWGAYSCYGYFDDLAINSPYGIRNNSWLGLGGIIGLVPDGAGNYTQLTPSAGANWQCVDEVPPDDDAAYVEDAVVDQKDTYEMEDLPIIPPGKVADIAAVQWLCRGLNTVSESGNFARLFRLSGVDYQGDDVGYDRSYDYHPEIIEASPATMQNWTGDEVNALEAGVVVR